MQVWLILAYLVAHSQCYRGQVCTEHDECEAGETCHFIHSLISICINGQQPLTSMEAEALKDVNAVPEEEEPLRPVQSYQPYQGPNPPHPVNTLNPMEPQNGANFDNLNPKEPQNGANFDNLNPIEPQNGANFDNLNPMEPQNGANFNAVPNEDNLDGNHGQGNAYYYQGQDNSNNPRQDQENTNPNPAPESTHPYLGPEYTNPTHLGLETAQVDQGYQNGDGNPRMVLLNEYNLHPMTSPGGAMGQEVDSEEIEEGPMTEEHIPSMYDDSFFTGVEQ